MNTPYKRRIGYSMLSTKCKAGLIAKDIILRSIKQRRTSIDFTNQLDIPIGLKELIVNHGVYF
jgi:hypothetical protein